MPFYQNHAPGLRGHERPVPDLSHLRGWKAQDAEAGLGDEQWARRGGEGARARPRGGRLDRGPRGDQLLPARRAAPLVGDQHLPQVPVPRGRSPRRRVRRRLPRRPLRHRHHLPLRDPLRAPGHAAHILPLHAVQLRDGDRPEGVAEDVRPRGRLLPRQHHQEPRPDRQGGRP